MASSPFDFLELVTEVCSRPSGYVGKVSYDYVARFLLGVQLGVKACGFRGPLDGFLEWMELRDGQASPIAWSCRFQDPSKSEAEQIQALLEAYREFQECLRSETVDDIKEKHKALFYTDC